MKVEHHDLPDRPPTSIRPATETDAEAIARIYNQGIEERSATLETEPRSADERRGWLAQREPRHTVLVAVDAHDNVLGWGSLNRFNPRSAYDHVVDFSIYVDRSARGRGIGHQLLDELEARARELGFHKLVLAGLANNAVGLRLYARHGFRTVGTYIEHGLIDGQWVDVVLMEKLL